MKIKNKQNNRHEHFSISLNKKMATLLKFWKKCTFYFIIEIWFEKIGEIAETSYNYLSLT